MKFSGYCFFMKTNIYGDFQICISASLKHFMNLIKPFSPVKWLWSCFVNYKISLFKSIKTRLLIWNLKYLMLKMNLSSQVFHSFVWDLHETEETVRRCSGVFQHSQDNTCAGGSFLINIVPGLKHGIPEKWDPGL